jgi:hypothetical protein
MPKCVVCGDEIQCTRQHDQPVPVGQAAVGCSSKKGALWIHVTDDQGKNVPEMKAYKDGDDKNTDANGVSAFDPLDQKNGYKAKLGDLTEKLAADYDLPTEKEQSANVFNGAITYVNFVLPRKAQLKAEVVQEGGAAKRFEKAEVSVVEGPSKPAAKKTASGTQIADLGKVSKGEYTVKAELDPEDAKDYHVKGPATIKLEAGEDKQVARIAVLERAVAKVEVADPKVVVVARDYHGKDKPGVKPHRIPVKLSYAGDFDGKCELSCDKASGTTPTNHVRVFLDKDAAASDEKPLPLELDRAEVKAGKTVYVEGRNPSDAVAGTELKLTLKEGTIPPKTATATEKITCVQLQLDVYKSRPDDGGDPALVDADKKIDPGRHVLVQGTDAKRLFAERAQLIVRKAKPDGFTGKLVLTPLTGGVEVFAHDQEKPADGQTAKSGDDLKLTNAGIDATNGTKFWVQGKTKSGAMGDTGWGLGVEVDGAAIKMDGKEVEGDRVTMTVLKAELRLFQSRTVIPTAGEPAQFSDDDKIDKGRYLHKQIGKHHGRALVVVRKVEPDGFEGKLVLSAWDVTHTPSYTEAKAASPKVEVFPHDKEVPADGDTAETLPKEIDHPKTYSTDGTKFWVQGKEVSGALRDTQLRLGVKEADKGCDRAAFTVVRFKKLKADIPSTPANTPRGGNSPVPRHELKLADGALEAKDFDEVPATNKPLFLVEGSIKDSDKIKLTVEIEPDAAKDAVLWSVQRDSRPGEGDHANVKSLTGNSEDPGLAQDGADKLKATLTANAVGSFHVRPYVDGNGNNKFDHNDDTGKRIDRDPFIIMNLVLIRVQGVSNLSVANSAAGNPVIIKQNVDLGGFLGVRSVPTGVSNGDFNGTGNDAVTMRATVHVIGGGQTGTLGLDKLFCGWVNNELNCPSSPSPGGFGEDVTHYHRRNPLGSPMIRLRCFWRLGGIEISGPVMDSGYDNQGTGGNTCTGTARTNMSGRPDTSVAHGSGIGQVWDVKNVDSPSGGVQHVHPTDGSAYLKRFCFNIDFRCDLVFWTSREGVAGPDDHPACRLYSTVQTNTWNIRLESTFNAAFAEAVVTAKTVTFTKDGSATRRATPVDGSGLETRIPDGLAVLVPDDPS